MTNIYISSITMHKYPLKDIISNCVNNDWALEFSSNIQYQSNLVQLYLNANIEKIIHNYFPAPEKAFVLNLASSNDEVRLASIKHCMLGIDLAKVSSKRMYSVHAGFCVDPGVSELGSKISVNSSFNKDANLQHFFNSLEQLLIYSKERRVELLIENNVISRQNLQKGINPLLCCSGAEIIFVMEQFKDRGLKLLLDTAHLKVSCKTLGLNLLSEMEKILPYVGAVHHSDNDGDIDSNLRLDMNYWARGFMQYFKSIPNVIEVLNLSVTEINEQIRLLKSWI